MFHSLCTRILFVTVSLILLTSITTIIFVQHETEQAILSARHNHALNLIQTVALNVENEYKSLLFHKAVMLERRKLELKNVIDLVSGAIHESYRKAQAGLIGNDEAKRTVIELIETLRYDNGVGYVWINDTRRPLPRMIVHPTIPQLNGKILDDPAFNCALHRRQNLFQAMVDVSLADGQGFVDYLWPKPMDGGLTVEQPKISYVRLFKPWNWVVGTGVYIDDIEAETQKRLDAVIDELEQTFSKVKVADSGYLYMFNGQREMLIHPLLEGTDFTTLNNPTTGHPILDDLIAAANRSSHFLDYKWNKPTEDPGHYDFWKRSYVTYFEPLGWYIAASVYFDEIRAPSQALRAKILYISMVFLTAALIGSLLLSKSLVKPLHRLTAAAKRIQHRGIDASDIPIMGTVETRELGTILGYMIRSIKAAVRAKEELLNALEAGNLELSRTNIKLESEIRSRRDTEKKLRATLDEKEILMREIHHRVKNNLAMIVSLLRLQEASFTDERIKMALNDSRSRIHAMALIHETLYRSENLANLKVDQYISKLIDAVKAAMEKAAGRVHFKVLTDDIQLSSDQAVYCGLILNELITNALKYAFPDNSGIIAITARYKRERSWIGLTVSDNGIGMPEDWEQRRKDSLGMRIISLLIEHQLEGEWRLENDNGTHFFIEWPLAVP
jgi:two-component sensor histidine kinase